jgi:hypothetical protein
VWVVVGVGWEADVGGWFCRAGRFWCGVRCVGVFVYGRACVGVGVGAGAYREGVQGRSRTVPAVWLTARGAVTRSWIVATAAEMVRVRGVGGTALDDVVTASGVSKSQL